MCRALYEDVFRRATGLHEPDGPYPYQAKLATDRSFPELLDIPTGLGKTLAVVLAWLFRRRFHPDKNIRDATPRRFVYCLPMRVLVEQTYEEIIRWLDRLGLLAGEARWEEADDRKALAHYQADPPDHRPVRWAKDKGDHGEYRIATHLLMGGENQTDWALWPERDAILIGTQDMLLSRALNRGYAARRARWPIEFGLLHNDCLWAFDEVQIMGSALATTAQLDAFPKRLWNRVIPSRFLWMSATLDSGILQTRDRKDWDIQLDPARKLDKEDYPAIRDRLQAPKTLNVVNARPKVTKILKAHPHGRISLLILNTVRAARSVYEEIQRELLKSAGKKPVESRPMVCLLHSRFRPMDRERQMRFLREFLENTDDDGSVPDSEGLIVVSTQVIEAGVDVSAAQLWSEIAPWPSVIQRLGRLNREGAQPEASATFWMPKMDDNNKTDASPNAKRVGPYDKTDLNAAKKLLEGVIAEQAGGHTYRDALDAILVTKESQEAMRSEPELIIRPNDFFELFSTEPDLAGGFTNVSHFVRNQDRNVDVHVFWRDFGPAKVKQPTEPAPVREELCPVPFFDVRQFLGKTRIAWEWDFDSGKWQPRRAADIQPGMTLMLPKSAGGYRTDMGWTGNDKDRLFDVLPGSSDDDSLDADFLSRSQGWILLSDHLTDVEAEVRKILQSLELQETPYSKPLVTAARWHDWGKSVDKWQGALTAHIANASEKLGEVAQSTALHGIGDIVAEWRERLQANNGVPGLWAKFPDVRAVCMDPRLDLSDPERVNLSRRLNVPFRPALRHEAASALAAWQSWLEKCDDLTALAVYLIACHHGKVRTILRSPRGNNDVFGVTDDGTLRPIADLFPKSIQLRTDAKYVGAYGEWDRAENTFSIISPSWVQMVAELLGPKHEDELVTTEVIPENEPRNLGPLSVGYLEALLRAADVRASRQPGKGGKS